MGTWHQIRDDVIVKSRNYRDAGPEDIETGADGNPVWRPEVAIAGPDYNAAAQLRVDGLAVEPTRVVNSWTVQDLPLDEAKHNLEAVTAEDAKQKIVVDHDWPEHGQRNDSNQRGDALLDLVRALGADAWGADETSWPPDVKNLLALATGDAEKWQETRGVRVVANQAQADIAATATVADAIAVYDAIPWPPATRTGPARR